MAVGTAITTRSSRPVSVEVAVAPTTQAVEAPPTVCLVGLTSFDHPLLSRTIPRAVIRETRFRDDDVHVEHVRITSREAAEALPGLSLPHPSKLRDAARLALGCGARSVDIVLARVRDDRRTDDDDRNGRGRALAPWELDHPDFLHAIDAFVAGMVGTNMVYPDLGGPVPVGPNTETELEQRVDRFVRGVAAHAHRWAERYQLAFLDDLGAGGALGHRVLAAAAGTDAVLCRWSGEPTLVEPHAWRSAGAFMAGILGARGDDLVSGLAGVRAPLEGGRLLRRGRYGDLSRDDAWRAKLPEDLYYAEVEPDGTGWGHVRSDPTLRAPVGSWGVPAVRLAKVIHWRVMQATSRFVFDTADVGRAVALASAVTQAMAPYARAGLLTGPEGEGEPAVRGGVVRDPAAPGLRVDIGAQLRPWTHRIQMRVNLRPGGAPVVEEVA
jgi:hypothetical protein